jgi:hypothetical protein
MNHHFHPFRVQAAAKYVVLADLSSVLVAADGSVQNYFVVLRD